MQGYVSSFNLFQKSIRTGAEDLAIARHVLKSKCVNTSEVSAVYLSYGAIDNQLRMVDIQFLNHLGKKALYSVSPSEWVELKSKFL